MPRTRRRKRKWDCTFDILPEESNTQISENEESTLASLKSPKRFKTKKSNSLPTEECCKNASVDRTDGKLLSNEDERSASTVNEDERSAFTVNEDEHSESIINEAELKVKTILESSRSLKQKTLCQSAIDKNRITSERKTSGFSETVEMPQRKVNVGNKKTDNLPDISNKPLNKQTKNPLDFPGNSFIICLRYMGESKDVFDCILCHNTSMKFTLDQIILHGTSRNHLLKVLELTDPTEYKVSLNSPVKGPSHIKTFLQNCSTNVDEGDICISSSSKYLIDRENISQRIFTLKKQKTVKTQISFGGKPKKIPISFPKKDVDTSPTTKGKTNVKSSNKDIPTVSKERNVDSGMKEIFKLDDSEHELHLNNEEKEVFLKYKKELNEMVKLQKGRYPTKIILVTDDRDRFIFLKSVFHIKSYTFHVLRRKNLCLENAFEYLKNMEEFGTGVLFVILCGINDINENSYHPSCIKKECSQPFNFLDFTTMSVDLIRKALDLHFMILKNTENDMVLFSGLIPTSPNTFNKIALQKRNCFALHGVAKYKPRMTFDRNSLFRYSQFAKVHSKAFGFSPLNLEPFWDNAANALDFHFVEEEILKNGFHYATRYAKTRKMTVSSKCYAYMKKLSKRFNMHQKWQRKYNVGSQPSLVKESQSSCSDQSNVLPDRSCSPQIASFRKSKYDIIAVLGNSQYNYFLDKIKGPRVCVMSDDISMEDLIDYIDDKKKLMPPKTLWILVTGINFLFCKQPKEMCTYHECLRPLFTVQPTEVVRTMSNARNTIEELLDVLKGLVRNVNKILNSDSDFLVFPPIPPAVVVDTMNHLDLHSLIVLNPRSYIMEEESYVYFNNLFQQLSIGFSKLTISSFRKLGICRTYLLDYLREKSDQMDCIDPLEVIEASELKFFRYWCHVFEKTAASALELFAEDLITSLPSRIVLYDDEDVTKPLQNRTVYIDSNEDKSTNIDEYKELDRSGPSNIHKTEMPKSLVSSDNKTNVESISRKTELAKSLHAQNTNESISQLSKSKNNLSNESSLTDSLKKYVYKQKDVNQSSDSNVSTLTKCFRNKAENVGDSSKISVFKSPVKESSTKISSGNIDQEITSSISIKKVKPSKTDITNRKQESFIDIATDSRPMSFKVYPNEECLESFETTDKSSLPESVSDDENSANDLEDEIFNDDDLADEILKDLADDDDDDDFLSVIEDDNELTETPESRVHEKEQHTYNDDDDRDNEDIIDSDNEDIIDSDNEDIIDSELNKEPAKISELLVREQGQKNYDILSVKNDQVQAEAEVQDYDKEHASKSEVAISEIQLHERKQTSNYDEGILAIENDEVQTETSVQVHEKEQTIKDDILPIENEKEQTEISEWQVHEARITYNDNDDDKNEEDILDFEYDEEQAETSELHVDENEQTSNDNDEDDDDILEIEKDTEQAESREVDLIDLTDDDPENCIKSILMKKNNDDEAKISNLTNEMSCFKNHEQKNKVESECKVQNKNVKDCRKLDSQIASCVSNEKGPNISCRKTDIMLNPSHYDVTTTTTEQKRCAIIIGNKYVRSYLSEKFKNKYLFWNLELPLNWTEMENNILALKRGFSYLFIIVGDISFGCKEVVFSGCLKSKCETQITYLNCSDVYDESLMKQKVSAIKLLIRKLNEIPMVKSRTIVTPLLPRECLQSPPNLNSEIHNWVHQVCCHKHKPCFLNGPISSWDEVVVLLKKYWSFLINYTVMHDPLSKYLSSFNKISRVSIGKSFRTGLDYPFHLRNLWTENIVNILDKFCLEKSFNVDDDDIQIVSKNTEKQEKMSKKVDKSNEILDTIETSMKDDIQIVSQNIKEHERISKEADKLNLILDTIETSRWKTTVEAKKAVPTETIKDAIFSLTVTEILKETETMQQPVVDCVKKQLSLEDIVQSSEEDDDFLLSEELEREILDAEEEIDDEKMDEIEEDLEDLEKGNQDRNVEPKDLNYHQINKLVSPYPSDVATKVKASSTKALNVQNEHKLMPKTQIDYEDEQNVLENYELEVPVTADENENKESDIEQGEKETSFKETESTSDLFNKTMSHEDDTYILPDKRHQLLEEGAMNLKNNFEKTSTSDVPKTNLKIMIDVDKNNESSSSAVLKRSPEQLEALKSLKANDSLKEDEAKVENLVSHSNSNISAESIQTEDHLTKNFETSKICCEPFLKEVVVAKSPSTFLNNADDLVNIREDNHVTIEGFIVNVEDDQLQHKTMAIHSQEILKSKMNSEQVVLNTEVSPKTADILAGNHKICDVQGHISDVSTLVEESFSSHNTELHCLTSGNIKNQSDLESNEIQKSEVLKEEDGSSHISCHSAETDSHALNVNSLVNDNSSSSECHDNLLGQKYELNAELVLKDQEREIDNIMDGSTCSTTLPEIENIVVSNKKPEMFEDYSLLKCEANKGFEITERSLDLNKVENIVNVPVNEDELLSVVKVSVQDSKLIDNQDDKDVDHLIYENDNLMKEELKHVDKTATTTTFEPMKNEQISVVKLSPVLSLNVAESDEVNLPMNQFHIVDLSENDTTKGLGTEINVHTDNKLQKPEYKPVEEKRLENVQMLKSEDINEASSINESSSVEVHSSQDKETRSQTLFLSLPNKDDNASHNQLKKQNVNDYVHVKDLEVEKFAVQLTYNTEKHLEHTFKQDNLSQNFISHLITSNKDGVKAEEVTTIMEINAGEGSLPDVGNIVKDSTAEVVTALETEKPVILRDEDITLITTNSTLKISSLEEDLHCEDIEEALAEAEADIFLSGDDDDDDDDDSDDSLAAVYKNIDPEDDDGEMLCVNEPNEDEGCLLNESAGDGSDIEKDDSVDKNSVVEVLSEDENVKSDIKENFEELSKSENLVKLAKNYIEDQTLIEGFSVVDHSSAKSDVENKAVGIETIEGQLLTKNYVKNWLKDGDVGNQVVDENNDDQDLLISENNVVETEIDSDQRANTVTSENLIKDSAQTGINFESQLYANEFSGDKIQEVDNPILNNALTLNEKESEVLQSKIVAKDYFSVNVMIENTSENLATKVSEDRAESGSDLAETNVNIEFELEDNSNEQPVDVELADKNLIKKDSPLDASNIVPVESNLLKESATAEDTLEEKDDDDNDDDDDDELAEAFLDLADSSDEYEEGEMVKDHLVDDNINIVDLVQKNLTSEKDGCDSNSIMKERCPDDAELIDKCEDIDDGKNDLVGTEGNIIATDFENNFGKGVNKLKNKWIADFNAVKNSSSQDDLPQSISVSENSPPINSSNSVGELCKEKISKDSANYVNVFSVLDSDHHITQDSEMLETANRPFNFPLQESSCEPQEIGFFEQEKNEDNQSTQQSTNLYESLMNSSTKDKDDANTVSPVLVDSEMESDEDIDELAEAFGNVESEDENLKDETIDVNEVKSAQQNTNLNESLMNASTIDKDDANTVSPVLVDGEIVSDEDIDELAESFGNVESEDENLKDETIDVNEVKSTQQNTNLYESLMNASTIDKDDANTLSPVLVDGEMVSDEDIDELAEAFGNVESEDENLKDETIDVNEVKSTQQNTNLYESVMNDSTIDKDDANTVSPVLVDGEMESDEDIDELAEAFGNVESEDENLKDETIDGNEVKEDSSQKVVYPETANDLSEVECVSSYKEHANLSEAFTNAESDTDDEAADRRKSKLHSELKDNILQEICLQGTVDDISKIEEIESDEICEDLTESEDIFNALDKKNKEVHKKEVVLSGTAADLSIAEKDIDSDHDDLAENFESEVGDEVVDVENAEEYSDLVEVIKEVEISLTENVLSEAEKLEPDANCDLADEVVDVENKEISDLVKEVIQIVEFTGTGNKLSKPRAMESDEEYDDLAEAFADVVSEEEDLECEPASKIKENLPESLSHKETSLLQSISVLPKVATMPLYEDVLSAIKDNDFADIESNQENFSCQKIGKDDSKLIIDESVSANMAEKFVQSDKDLSDKEVEFIKNDQIVQEKSIVTSSLAHVITENDSILPDVTVERPEPDKQNESELEKEAFDTQKRVGNYVAFDQNVSDINTVNKNLPGFIENIVCDEKVTTEVHLVNKDYISHDEGGDDSIPDNISTLSEEDIETNCKSTLTKDIKFVNSSNKYEASCTDKESRFVIKSTSLDAVAVNYFDISDSEEEIDQEFDDIITNELSLKEDIVTLEETLKKDAATLESLPLNAVMQESVSMLKDRDMISVCEIDVVPNRELENDNNTKEFSQMAKEKLAQDALILYDEKELLIEDDINDQVNEKDSTDASILSQEDDIKDHQSEEESYSNGNNLSLPINETIEVNVTWQSTFENASQDKLEKTKETMGSDEYIFTTLLEKVKEPQTESLSPENDSVKDASCTNDGESVTLSTVGETNPIKTDDATALCPSSSLNVTLSCLSSLDSISNIRMPEETCPVKNTKLDNIQQTLKDSSKTEDEELEVLEKEVKIIPLIDISDSELNDSNNLFDPSIKIKTEKIHTDKNVAEVSHSLFKPGFDHIYIMGQYNPLEKETTEVLKHTFIKRDLSSLEINNVDEIFEAMEPIIPKSVCVLIFNFSVITKAHLSSKSFLQKGSKDDIIIHVLKNSPEISMEAGKKFISSRIASLINIINKISSQVPVVTFPLEPARIYAQYNFALGESQKSSLESYFVYGPSYKWSQYRSHLVNEWNKLLETNNELINNSCLVKFSKIPENIFPLKKHGLQGVNITEIRQSWKQNINKAMSMMCVAKVQNIVSSGHNEDKQNSLQDESSKEDKSVSATHDQKKLKYRVTIRNISTSIADGFFDELGKSVDQETVILHGKGKVDLLFKSNSYASLVSKFMDGLFLGDRITKSDVSKEVHDDHYSKAEKQEIKRICKSVVFNWEANIKERLQKELLQVVNFTSYKTVKCEKEDCDVMHCIYFHNEEDRRRNPLNIAYMPKPCFYDPCSKGDNCIHCHNVFESMFHPQNFYLQPCFKFKSREECFANHPLCIFAHKDCADSFFTMFWTDILVSGTSFAFQYLAGAIQRFNLTDPFFNNCRIFMLGYSDKFLRKVQGAVSQICHMHSLPHAFLGEREIFFENEPLLFGKPSSFVKFHGRVVLPIFSVVIVSQIHEIMEDKDQKKALEEFFSRCKSRDPPFFIQKVFVADSPESRPLRLRSDLCSLLKIKLRMPVNPQPVIPFKHDVPYRPPKEPPIWMKPMKQPKPLKLPPKELKKAPPANWFRKEELLEISDSCSLSDSSEEKEGTSEHEKASSSRKRRRSSKSISLSPDSSKRQKEDDMSDISLSSEEDKVQSSRRSLDVGRGKMKRYKSSDRDLKRRRSSKNESPIRRKSRERQLESKRSRWSSSSRSRSGSPRSRRSGSRSSKILRSRSRSRFSRTRSTQRDSAPTNPPSIKGSSLVPYRNSPSLSPQRREKGLKGKGVNPVLSSLSSITHVSDNEKKPREVSKKDSAKELSDRVSILLKLSSRCYNLIDLRKKIGEKLYKEFSNEEREVCSKLEEEFEVFREMPDLYDKYEECYENFMEKYVLKYPNEDEEHKDRLWAEFWKSKFEYVKKCELESRISKLKKNYTSKIDSVSPVLSASHTFYNPLTIPAPVLSASHTSYNPLPVPAPVLSASHTSYNPLPVPAPVLSASHTSYNPLPVSAPVRFASHTSYNPLPVPAPVLSTSHTSYNPRPVPAPVLSTSHTSYNPLPVPAPVFSASHTSYNPMPVPAPFPPPVPISYPSSVPTPFPPPVPVSFPQVSTPFPPPAPRMTSLSSSSSAASKQFPSPVPPPNPIFSATSKTTAVPTPVPPPILDSKALSDVIKSLQKYFPTDPNIGKETCKNELPSTSKREKSSSSAKPVRSVYDSRTSRREESVKDKSSHIMREGRSLNSVVPITDKARHSYINKILPPLAELASTSTQVQSRVNKILKDPHSPSKHKERSCPKEIIHSSKSKRDINERSSTKNISLHRTTTNKASNRDPPQKGRNVTKIESSQRETKDPQSSKTVVQDSKRSTFDVNKGLNMLKSMIPDLGALGHSIASMLVKTEELGKNTTSALKVFVDSDNVLLVEMALKKIKTKYESEGKLEQASSLNKYVKGLLEHAEKSQKKVCRLNLESIAKATSGNDTKSVLNMIRTIAAYEGVELSDEEVNNVFMEVCAIHVKFSLNEEL